MYCGKQRKENYKQFYILTGWPVSPYVHTHNPHETINGRKIFDKSILQVKTFLSKYGNTKGLKQTMVWAWIELAASKS